ncbi:hypothetical protein swp_4277 [Shewanella piezotolerans WP3]|uniref:Uncharacterized protein n=1 Tax=Shewanella piezotolerans (strain WP3 / JCM 13877) TaxID=225849 RepID=B8CU72_SHEPW|nr:hypothetical protein swp_4277 [Shewanella piezotolerans WP3]
MPTLLIKKSLKKEKTIILGEDYSKISHLALANILSNTSH